MWYHDTLPLLIQRLGRVVAPGRIPRRGLVWAGLWCGVCVGGWGCSGCGWLMGRVVWTVGWFLPVVTHPVVVWEVVVSTDCEMRSLPGRIPRRGLVWAGLWCNGVWVGRWGGSGCAAGAWVGVFGPWGGSSQSYHTPWLCGRSWSTQIVRCGHSGTDSPAWAGLGWSLVGSGWVGGVVPVAVGSWVGVFGPWGDSSRSYHTPWSCGRSWSTQIVRCGHSPGRIPRRMCCCICKNCSPCMKVMRSKYFDGPFPDDDVFPPPLDVDSPIAFTVADSAPVTCLM